ncbi:MAG: carbohydrate binding family 9 domain-containing protein, partial [bacterium]
MQQNPIPRQIVLYLFIFFYLVLLVPTSPHAKNSKEPHLVPKVRPGVKIDAVLDEEIWSRALTLELNYEVRPGENVPPPVRTEVLLAYCETHFYAAFRAYDPDPSKIRARISDRDHMYDDDWVALIIDTFNDERRMFDYFSNPLGVQGDMIECPDCSGDSWDAIWESAGRITDWGYVVEMAIPFSSMRFPRTEGEQVWNFDAVRSYPRMVRHHIGLFPRDRNNNCYLCQAEEIVGFAGVTPGRNIEFDPTFNTLYSQEREDFSKDYLVDKDKDYEFGLTTRWGITPNLQLNTTLNPDFSQVEADVAELDINTTFAIYYPEKRPFFLEGTELFNTRFNTVYTRTLAEPNWGIKLTGKEGKNAIGYYTVQDKITNFLLPGSQGSDELTTYKKSIGSAFRYRRDIFEASTIGLLLTDRENEDYYNRVAGVDGIIKFTKKDQVRFQFFGSQTSYPDSIVEKYDQPKGSFSAGAMDVFYLHDTDGLDWYALYRETGA